MVPTANLLCIAVSILLAAGVPVALFIFFKVKYKAKWVPMLVGAAAFVLFALVLEQIPHLLVLRPDAAGNIALMQRPVLYILYGIFAAGIFEETARFLSFLLLKRRYSGIETALSYGVGHGGIESILLGALSMVSLLALSLSVNSGTVEATRSLLSGPALASLDAQVDALRNSPPADFLLAGFERLCAMAVQISLSVLVFYAAALKGKRWLYPGAILLHAAVNIPAAAYQVGLIKNIYVVEGLVAAAAVLLVLLAVFTHKKLKGGLPAAPAATTLPPPVPQAAQQDEYVARVVPAPPAAGDGPLPQSPTSGGLE